MVIDHTSVQKIDMGKGFLRQDFPMGEKMNVLHWDIMNLSELALHTHPEEQFGYVIKGSFRLTIGDEVFVIKAGDGYLVPSGVPHSCVAIGDVETLDIFSPAKMFPWKKK